MALVDVVGGLWMPMPHYYGGVLPAFGSVLLDAAADRVCMIFYAPKTGNISKIGFLTGTVPALNASSELLFSLQDISLTTGLPDDTDDQSATIVNGSIVANTMILSPALSADRAVTKGDLVGAVVKFKVGSFTAGDQVNIRYLNFVTTISGPFGTEYGAQNATGAYAKFSVGPAVLEIEYSDGSHAFTPGTQFPYSAIASDTYNNTSTPDEIGLQFQVPFECRLAGCWLSADLDGDININLYTASTKTTVFAQDKDVRAVTTHVTFTPLFTTPVILAAATTYVLAIEPSSATSIVLVNHSVRAAVALDQMPGGQTWQYATAKNPATTGDFTATTTKRPVMGLMFDQVSDGFGPTAIGGPIGGPIRTQGWP